METFDLVVIGAGPGGYPAAIRGAQLGASVAIVEKERMGGTCLNWGCIPTKTLIASSSLYHRIKHADRLGITAGVSTFDYSAMVKRKDALVSKLNGGVEQLLKANGVKIFRGTAAELCKALNLIKKVILGVMLWGAGRVKEVNVEIQATGSVKSDSA
jgi:dihydrolipoamide dehydrogenase